MNCWHALDQAKADCTWAGMPLDNVHIQIKDQHLEMSWSDCSHICEGTKNYQTTFTYVSHQRHIVISITNAGIQKYIPENPNRRLSFEFEKESGTLLTSYTFALLITTQSCEKSRT